MAEDWKQKLDSISGSLEAICRTLTEHEDQINQQSQEQPLKIFEMLESVNEILSTARNIRPKRDLLEMQENDVRIQMELLQRSVDLLELESAE